MKIKKRYILLLVFVGLIVFGSVVPFTQPVLPVIQLPGECYPIASDIPLVGCITNTFVTTVVAWLIVAAIGLSLRARSRSADEVPTGFYNFFEMVIDGALGYATGVAGRKKVKMFFPLFLTIILYVLVANWLELVPPVDSIGFAEWIPHLEAEKAVSLAEADAALAGMTLSEQQISEIEHIAEEESDAANKGSFLNGIFLIKKSDGNAQEGNFSSADQRKGRDLSTADWALVSFFRAPATDLNFTLAIALVTMVFVQIVGFRYLGIGYLKKFLPWNVGVDVMATNPMKVMDWPVGILELVSEISRIISFSFRLLGNIFAGQVLLFVMAALVPVLSVAFFGLEFFVGLIQAAVFGLLGLMFMSGASESHGDEDHH
jgi:F-type H+-transporting ATPase subunit a